MIENNGKPEREFEQDFYEDFQRRLSLSDFPDSWKEFSEHLRDELPDPISLTEVEKATLWQAATGFRVGCSLIQGDDWIKVGVAGLPIHAIQTAGMQLILYTVMVQLRSWDARLFDKSPAFNRGIVGRIRKYLNREEFMELRHALSHVGGEDAKTYVKYDADTQSILFSTRGLRKLGKKGSIPFHEALFGAFLWWVLFSEWAWKGLVEP